ncbi:LytR/AlgR family response regulator transcription factor [Sphingomonas quercus]|uniref:LytTR family DNA-binding domain-containing protein n=1 Tax=Sphingomonas quercus TaxID=2842451 RepID=A0ABS6BHT7_9SPHN|nr:LytTR family DNA-binding domain-containing protein [Sphingomonas quercus]MBU3077749.1 LytTR family DNA-binding domain-containing protein [Sphingomonas quercus]
MAAERLRTLVVDDEPLAIERMQILCARLPAIDLVGTASDGDSALRLARSLAPDLLLLDIAMPGLDGLDVARALEGAARPPAVIFVTAFDQFAVSAFDVAAVDYLLKPVAADRLARAVDRVTARLADPPERAASDYAQEFWVPWRAEMVRIAAADIDRIEAERDYMRLHVGARSFLLHETISELERRLDPARFIRVHRSAIVRRDLVARLLHDGLGTWSMALADGTMLRIGRTYLPNVKQLAGR